MLWQVTTSAEKLLTATEHGRWPGAELAALAGYAQAEVLRQVSDEEALLFPLSPPRRRPGWPGITCGCALPPSCWPGRPPGNSPCLPPSSPPPSATS